MPPISIITDSTTHLSEEEKSRYPVEIVPVNVMFKGKVYKDGVDLSIEQAYQFLEQNPEDWATSAPSPGDFIAAYKKAADKGAKEILCLTIPPSISATWNSARNAKTMIEKELPGVRIEVVSSGTATIGGSLLVSKLSQAIAEGKGFEEILKMAETLKEKVRVYLILETIRYVYRSGRIPEVASKIGSLLPLKPILGVHSGKVRFAGATTSKEKSKEKLLDLLKKELDPKLPEICLSHIDNPEELVQLQEKTTALFPQANITLREFSPLIGYATGRGTIGIGYFAK